MVQLVVFVTRVLFKYGSTVVYLCISLPLIPSFTTESSRTASVCGDDL